MKIHFKQQVTFCSSMKPTFISHTGYSFILSSMTYENGVPVRCTVAVPDNDRCELSLIGKDFRVDFL